MRILFLILFMFIFLFSCKKQAINGISIDWKDNIEGDYSFIEKWNYPMAIYKNDYGQLVCDGLCDPQLDAMRDENGKIFNDSITRYYQLVDATHMHYSIQSESNVYEWIESNYIVSQKQTSDTVKCYTLCDPATHSSLHITLSGNICLPFIELHSVTPSGDICYRHTGGFIRIDKNLWRQDIFKADFYFTFDDPERPDQNLWWKGKIYSKIE